MWRRGRIRDVAGLDGRVGDASRGRKVGGEVRMRRVRVEGKSWVKMIWRTG